jgi:hypothetical protein
VVVSTRLSPGSQTKNRNRYERNAENTEDLAQFDDEVEELVPVLAATLEGDQE